MPNKREGSNKRAGCTDFFVHYMKSSSSGGTKLARISSLITIKYPSLWKQLNSTWSEYEYFVHFFRKAIEAQHVWLPCPKENIVKIKHCKFEFIIKIPSPWSLVPGPFYTVIRSIWIALFSFVCVSFITRFTEVCIFLMLSM